MFTSNRSASRPGAIQRSVVQWHHFSIFFFGVAPLKMVFPEKGAFFSQGH